ncbi:YciI family protein [Oerskovia flava]|uniref:YciI family protein n=1 Tax=Oerskovia flava TaxID=2986422 RepID=UPI00223F5DC7|nr:YciI family protein [Oerskovia sp. JB1-3-2]
MSTEYVIFIHDDEKNWATATPEQKEAAFARHDTFGTLCAERGHTITGGAELLAAATARLVRPGTAGAQAVTDGPFTETAEQLGGYYVVETDDVDGLTALIGEAFAGDTSTFEIRATVPEDPSSDAS